MPTFKIGEDTRCGLEKFKKYMRENEYTVTTVTGYCTYLSRFLRKAGIPQAGALKEAIEAFLKSERTECPQTFNDCRAALRLYYKMVTGDSLKENPETSTTSSIARLLQQFRAYSQQVKHLEESTANSEISHVRGFLEYVFGHNPQGFANGLTAEDIRRYVMERLAAHLDSSKGRMITSIRNFFRCQAFYGNPVHPSVFRLPLSPAVWKKSAFPTTIDTDIFNTLHMIPNVNTGTGHRDRCIILCFTVLAMRCSEVEALTRDDFNWR